MILIKQHNSSQVAHLYEHLFCAAVSDFFYSKELFSYIDFNVYGKVLPNGIIYVEVDCHSAPAKKLKDDIKNIPISLDESDLMACVAQIISEKQTRFVISTMNALGDELRQIDAKPWRHIDDIDIIDSQNMPLVPGAFYIPKERQDYPARDLAVTFKLNPQFAKTHPELLPLFWEQAQLMSHAVMEDMYSLHGAYSHKVSSWPKERVTRLKHEFKVSPQLTLDSKSALHEVARILSYLQQTNSYQIMSEELRTATYADPEKILPDPQRVYENTGLLIGTKGWQRIATAANTRLLLAHISVHVRLDKKQASTKLAPVLIRATKRRLVDATLAAYYMKKTGL